MAVVAVRYAQGIRGLEGAIWPVQALFRLSVRSRIAKYSHQRVRLKQQYRQVDCFYSHFEQ
jgi:hypothetical protein